MILGIETSCDETAAAILRNGKVISNIVLSQVDIHQFYGGVVPELASRHHLENLNRVVESALSQAEIDFTALTGIAVTRGPGLVGSLLAGLTAAKVFSYIFKLPLAGINHLEGHILSHRLQYPDFPSPFIALIISGGHCELVRVEGPGCYRVLGRTLDDAIGEAFDKVGKLLGLGYPGGPEIEKEAARGHPHAIPFPRPFLEKGSLDFSFSGLKTAVALYVKKKAPLGQEEIADICASFQQAVFETLIEKMKRACQETGITRIVFGGGVASNRTLRKLFKEEACKNGWNVCFPPPVFCVDNAAMIAYAGESRLTQKEYSGEDLVRETIVEPNLRL